MKNLVLMVDNSRISLIALLTKGLATEGFKTLQVDTTPDESFNLVLEVSPELIVVGCKTPWREFCAKLSKI